jgi:hypothetical protein
MKEIERLICGLNKKMNKNSDYTPNIVVNVLGTEERKNNTFSKYTIYVIEILIENLPFKIFVRYSDMVKFAKELIKTSKDINISFPKLDTMNFLTNCKTKVIE